MPIIFDEERMALTRLRVLATAGVRALNPAPQKALWDEVRRVFTSSANPFKTAAEDVIIVAGNLEARPLAPDRARRPILTRTGASAVRRASSAGSARTTWSTVPSKQRSTPKL